MLADDGARLAAWVHEPATTTTATTPTLVLAHGWALSHEAWTPVLPALQEAAVRVVTYDQRGHGASTPRGARRRGDRRDDRRENGGRRRRPARPSVRGLGDDLAAVLAAVAPTGPVVLGGHSMGGMTVMAYCGSHRDAVRERVRGVALVSTSAGDLRGLGRRGETTLMRAVARVPGLRPGRVITVEGQRRLLFGHAADPSAVRATRDMVATTSLSTIGRYYGALGRHDEVEALAVLAGVPTHVLVGERDRLTPVSHARRLAALVPGAELEIVPGAGHMLAFEAPDVVARHLLRLVEGAA